MIDIKNIAQNLLEKSDFVSHHNELLQQLLTSKAWSHHFSLDLYSQELSDLLPKTLDDFARELRLFRHTHLIRLLLREAAGLVDVAETMRAWSEIADALILVTLAYCRCQIKKIYGESLDSKGQPIKLFPLALGKLGGNELNFSSDIDLIFVYEESGQTCGPHVITNEQFFTKIIQKAIHLLQNISVDGFVFRVDLRLRPFGASGALAMSLAATETYYQEQGRDWERYAMIKARLIGEDTASLFKRFITPFLYRRYVDFSVIESLRNMKILIEKELILNPALNDIKRGFGGIREIEFIIQCFQLIRGGRIKQLQTQNAMKALGVLANEEMLRWPGVLKEAYLFYRKLENALQTFADQQTHTLPADSRGQSYVLYMMQYDSYEQLYKKFSQYQRIVGYLFRRTMGARGGHEVIDNALEQPLIQIWQGHIEPTMAIGALRHLGVKYPGQTYRLLQQFRHHPKCRRLSQLTRLRLERLMVRFLQEMATTTYSEETLLAMFRLFDNIIGRSAYLALFTENEHALRKVVDWFQSSPLITEWVVMHPFLLDYLINQNSNWKPLSYVQLKILLQSQLNNMTDVEAQEEYLREFKLIHWLNIACAELDGRCTATRASRFLSDLAQVILLFVVELAYKQLADKYPEINQIKDKFSLLMYGKLGSKEMNFHSDLDLVFLHHVPFSEERLMTRLTQKILYMLTMRSRAGVLYTTDTRLRPSGSSGLLVSHLPAFIEYQCTQAWVWEHQALLKARILLGNQEMRRRFLGLKQAIFLQVRNQESLFQEIQSMRSKIKQHQVHHPIKSQEGGLLDLEFLVQYLVMMTPNHLWFRVTNTERQLQYLHMLGVLDNEQRRVLTDAFRYFHAYLHQQALVSHDEPIDLAHSQAVLSVYVMKSPNRS